MKPILFTTIGGPGSGKSYFTSNLTQSIPMVRLNNDAMRTALFDEPMLPENMHNYRTIYGAMDYATRASLQAGMSVIYDANVNQRELREKNVQIAAETGADAITLWVKTPFDVCVQRVTSRNITDEQFRVGSETVKKHFDSLEEPDDTERVIIIDGTATPDEQIQQFRSQLSQLQDS